MILMISLLSSVIGIISTFNILKWKPKQRLVKSHARYSKVSILKPIRGLEPDLRENLLSFFKLKKNIPFELLFCLKNPEDPAVQLIQELMREFPEVESRLFTGFDNREFGKNPKVSNLHRAWRHTSTDLVLISDSNVRVPPDYLEGLIAERQSGAGLVTQPTYSVDAETLGGHLDVIHMNTFYLKCTAFLNFLGFTCVVGKCMLFSQSQFEKIGGLFSVRNYLAEDLVAGEMMKEAGYTVKLAPKLLRQTTIMNNFSAYWNRHVRWARLRKCHYFFAYFFEPLFFESLWPLLLIIFASNPFERTVGYITLVLEISCNLLIHGLKFREGGAWASLKYFALKDMVGPFIWASGLLSNKVVWRGQILQLRFGGKLASKYRSRARLRKIHSAVFLR